MALFPRTWDRPPERAETSLIVVLSPFRSYLRIALICVAVLVLDSASAYDGPRSVLAGRGAFLAGLPTVAAAVRELILPPQQTADQ